MQSNVNIIHGTDRRWSKREEKKWWKQTITCSKWRSWCRLGFLFLLQGRVGNFFYRYSSLMIHLNHLHWLIIVIISVLCFQDLNWFNLWLHINFETNHRTCNFWALYIFQMRCSSRTHFWAINFFPIYSIKATLLH